MPVSRNDVDHTIEYTDLGVTMRTLMGYAAEGYKKTGRRVWMLLYNGVNVGKLQVRSNLMERKDAPTNNGNGPSPDRSRKEKGAGKPSGLSKSASRTAGRQAEAEGSDERTSVEVRKRTPAIQVRKNQGVSGPGQ